ncbi:two-component system sensor histidine kinase YesM [Fontibacillus phaseoli]|uniref:histidine kinase n=1 Tax=Fontibacillus phaseoli TaxID=1416533 RepID=A0A369AV94_9BACL|nr:sensor histidine kinase [Fontibacillus phaseoli]RCX13300.1 two-component system sensor histidine kinase YesM [Fontibacillus phaseoli]
MKHWRKYIERNRWSISKILNTSFFLMITVPILLVTLYSVRSLNSILLNNTTSQAMQTLEQQSDGFDSKARMIINTVSAIANDDQVISTSAAIHKNDGASSQFDLRRALDKQLNNYFHYTPDVASVLFFYKDQGSYAYKRNMDVDVAGLRRMDWYEDTEKRKNKVHLMGIQESASSIPDGGYYFTVAVSPKYSTLFYNVEMIYCVFRSSDFMERLDVSGGGGGDIYVVGPEGQVMASNDDQALHEGMGNYEYLQPALSGAKGSYVKTVNNVQSYVIYTTSDLGWKYVKVVPYEQIINQVKSVFGKIILFSVGGLIVFLIASYWLVRSIVNPIIRLFKGMTYIKSGNLKTQLEASGPLEIYVLGHAFNEMVANMDRLFAEAKEQEDQKRLAEIRALQSQINPHFLLNTLNTIKLMATISKSENIQKMTDALTKLLSSTFNRGGMYATVGEEISLLDDYIRIMKIRYGDLFDIHYDVDPEIGQAYILKLLLQPIIENAIIHGLHERETRGNISVFGEWGDGCCRFTIEDDGVGIREEELPFLLERRVKSKESFSGLGLRNVQERIRLNYGEAYGLEITSVWGEGTSVLVVLPLLWEAPHTKEKGERE